jgi:hypothetical protein
MMRAPGKFRIAKKWGTLCVGSGVVVTSEKLGLFLDCIVGTFEDLSFAPILAWEHRHQNKKNSSLLEKIKKTAPPEKKTGFFWR